MIVRLLKDDPRFHIKKGEIFHAKTYPLDPGKITLLRRIPDNFDPECNQYRGDVKVISAAENLPEERKKITDEFLDELIDVVLENVYCDHHTEEVEGQLFDDVQYLVNDEEGCKKKLRDLFEKEK